MNGSKETTTLFEYEVVSNERVADHIMRMMCCTDVARCLQPGQFVNLAVEGDASHILRIPLSFSHADAARGMLELVYAVVGEGTKRLSELRPGATNTLVGPCGVGWSLPKEEGRALLVAGGVGLPPIVACARMLMKAGVGFDAIVGAQTANKHVAYLLDYLRSCSKDEGCDCARKVIVTTDDGSMGMRGFTTTAMQNLLAENPYSSVYTCGPNVMMSGVARLAQQRSMACQVSLERMMGCGFGACSCCNVTMADGTNALCCKDGPVFDAREVAWE